MIGEDPDQETLGEAQEAMCKQFDQIGLGNDQLAKLGKGFLGSKETKFFKLKGCVLRGQEEKLLAPGVKVMATTPDETLVAVNVANMDLRLKTWIEINKLKGNYVEKFEGEVKGIEDILRELHGKRNQTA